MKRSAALSRRTTTALALVATIGGPAIGGTPGRELPRSSRWPPDRRCCPAHRHREATDFYADERTTTSRTPRGVCIGGSVQNMRSGCSGSLLEPGRQFHDPVHWIGRRRRGGGACHGHPGHQFLSPRPGHGRTTRPAPPGTLGLTAVRGTVGRQVRGPDLAYEFWNEPTRQAFWDPGRFPGGLYELLKVGYPADQVPDPSAWWSRFPHAGPHRPDGSFMSPVESWRLITLAGSQGLLRRAVLSPVQHTMPFSEARDALLRLPDRASTTLRDAHAATATTT
jgi:hypothetical protein